MKGVPEPTGPTRSALNGPVLFERDRELASLDGVIQETIDGRAAACVIEGPAGIGKTRLVAEARLRAGERGMTVLSASASELEQGFGFGVVGQLFEPAVRGEGRQLLSGAAAPARVIVGEDRDREPGGPEIDPSFASMDGLCWLTIRLSEQQPLLLAVDDLQWCDAPSLRFLAYLRARLEGLAVLLMCSVRHADPGPDDAVLDAVVGHPASVRVRPRALSEMATDALIERRLGEVPEGTFTEACHDATGGNPLLLEELMKVLEAEGARPDSAHLAMLKDLGPAAVPRTVFLRLRRLGADATKLAQALAVLGDGADLTALAALAGLDVGEAGAATAALARAEIVRTEPPLGFAHPLVASAVYRDVLPGQRELLHLRAAELLVAARAPVEHVAGHLLHAPPGGESWAVEQLAQAAAEASRKGAADSAASYLERALAEPPIPDRHAELLLALGRAKMLRDGAAAAEHLRAAYALLTDPDQRASAAELLGRALLFTGHGEEAARIVQEAAAALPDSLDARRQQLEALELFCVLFGAGGPEALRRLEPYRTKPVAAGGLGAKMMAAIAAQEWMYACGPSDAVAELSLAALSGGELVAADTGWAVSFPIANLAFADREEAEGWWELATAEAHRRGSLLDITAITFWRGDALHRRGELADAEESLRNCHAALDEWGYPDKVSKIYCDAHLASVLRDRGDIAGARDALGQGPDPGQNDEGARHWSGSQIELLLAERQFEHVLAAADDYASRFDHVVRNPMDVPWRSLKALALDQLDRGEEALELAWAELDLARSWGAPGTVARTLRALGTIEHQDGLAHLEEAVTVVAGSPARLEHAKALAALGAALRRARRPADSRAYLRQALELATVCGAETLTEQARSELYAAGGRPRRTALTGVGSLTASEWRVVVLAAEGRTNREVGESLFVAPKTVAMHLSNAYRKLGVTSRRELPAALAATASDPGSRPLPR